MKKLNISDVVDASYQNDLERLGILLREGLDLDQEDEVTTPLHAAVENCSIEAIEMLVSAGANINILERRSGLTPLHLAIENEIGFHTENSEGWNAEMYVSKKLIDLGADISVLNSKGVNSIDYATELRHETAMEYFKMTCIRGGSVDF